MKSGFVDGKKPRVLRVLDAGSLPGRIYYTVLGDLQQIVGSVEQSAYLSTSIVRLSTTLFAAEVGGIKNMYCRGS